MRSCMKSRPWDRDSEVLGGVFASPAIKDVCPTRPTVVPLPCWRPLMARPGYAWCALSSRASNNPNYQWDHAIRLRWSGVGKIKLKTSDVITEEEHEESQGWGLMPQFAMASVFWSLFRFPRNYPFLGKPGFCAFPQSTGVNRTFASSILEKPLRGPQK